jgi:hypothetical protein
VVEDMMEDYGIHHRISSLANPHTNARAELGVKTVKMMLMEIVSEKGMLDRAVVSRALLQLRYTQDRDSKLSQAKDLFERELRNFLPTCACQGDGSGTQGQTFREKVVWAHEDPGTIEGGGHSDGAKPVRQSPPLLGQKGDCHEVW